MQSVSNVQNVVCIFKQKQRCTVNAVILCKLCLLWQGLIACCCWLGYTNQMSANVPENLLHTTGNMLHEPETIANRSTPFPDWTCPRCYNVSWFKTLTSSDGCGHKWHLFLDVSGNLPVKWSNRSTSVAVFQVTVCLQLRLMSLATRWVWLTRETPLPSCTLITGMAAVLSTLCPKMMCSGSKRCTVRNLRIAYTMTEE